MQVIPRWRNVLILKNALIHSTKVVTSTQSANTHLASFHSTSICSEKWKNKWNSEFRGSQQPTKNYIRYATRQKRADSKKALKNLLFYGASESSFENESSAINDKWDVDRDDHSEKKSQFKSAARRRDRVRRRMRKMKKRSLDEDFDEYPETVFQATFGNKWYTWSFKPGKSSTFEDLFSRRQETDWSERRHCRWDNETERETETGSNYGSLNVGSYSERTILGLPPKGPLKIEDVKNAFRLSALKWHPDKHQGPSQEVKRKYTFASANRWDGREEEVEDCQLQMQQHKRDSNLALLHTNHCAPRSPQRLWLLFFERQKPKSPFIFNNSSVLCIII